MIQATTIVTFTETKTARLSLCNIMGNRRGEARLRAN